MVSHSTFQRIWLPGFLLQSVMIGGGYATGRELVEFFLSAGPVNGLLAMLVATAMFSIISALSFELARMTMSYNYRSFFHQLLGRGWFLFEIAYFALAILILAVLGAASGELVAEHLGLAKLGGTLLLMALIGVLVFWGTSLIEKVMAGWSFLLYITYALLVFLCLWRFGGDLLNNLAVEPVVSGWVKNGVLYAGYNLATIPIILFCVSHMASRKDAFTAGVLAGPLAMIPAFLFYLAMAAFYPDILNAAVPADFIFQQLEMSWISLVFYIVVFGTLVETGTAIIHAFNERISEVYREKNKVMPHWLRTGVALVALTLAVVLAGRIGLIDLIARGYGTLTWVFIAIFVVPLCTVGLWKIWRSAGSNLPGESPTRQI
jgi:uncharacterized membrane protein YkvI